MNLATQYIGARVGILPWCLLAILCALGTPTLAGVVQSADPNGRFFVAEGEPVREAADPQSPTSQRGDTFEGAPPEPPAEVAEDPPAAKSTDQRSPKEGLPPEPSESLDPQIPSQEAPPAEAPPETPEQPDVEPAPIVLRQYLILRAVDQYQRTPFQQDAIEAAIVSGQWQSPAEGDAVEGSTGMRRTWRALQVGEDGRLRDDALRGGYALATFDSPRRQTLLLYARGHSMVYVNGTPRTGDPYDTGWLRVPVQMNEGENEFLFHVGRNELFAQLEHAHGKASLDGRDATLPDLTIGETQPKWAALWVTNLTADVLRNLSIVARGSGAAELRTDPFDMPPLSVRKIPFQVDGNVDASAEQVQRNVELLAQDGESVQILDQQTLTLKALEPSQRHVRTFVSDVDGSVQYYAVQPAHTAATERSDTAPGADLPGLILSLHGAAVDAVAQAGQYSRREWAHVVAPTNRRPFGFDWEDWGRIDAFEALNDAQGRLPVDPRRIYLTGHSMGGHGAWHLGTTFPRRFAAVAPSAGWISFDTYTRSGALTAQTPTEQMLHRAANPSATLKLVRNLAATGVYVLHGTEDDNVPVREARTMREELAKFHADFAYYERVGAGHWWGSECVDWPAMMDFLQRHQLPQTKDVQRLDFTTMNPGVSATSSWLTIEAQQKQLEPSRAIIDCNVKDRRFSGTTVNIARLALDVSHFEPDGSIAIELDSQRLRDVRWPSVTRTIWLQRDGSRWTSVTPPANDVKGPHRYGTFKDVFRNRAVLVYGTRGNDEENRWAFSKARFDAETFLYRGNGGFEVVRDRDFEPADYPDRNVVLYGNADTNFAWPALLSTCPIQVRRGTLRVGLRTELGDDLGCLFIYPRRGTNAASVGVVSGTGMVGMELTNRMRYFVSGVSYPDLVIFDPDVLRHGGSATRAAGFFGLDWQLEEADIAWRDLAL